MRVILVVLLGLVCLTGCKDAPGADGRYATHNANQWRGP